MNKKKLMSFLLMLCSLCLVSCVKKDLMYYKLNPEKIQKALKTCTEDCDTLMKAETFVNQLSAELYRNPQAFGQKILSLQEKIVKEQIALRANNQPQSVQELKAHQETVAEYLAIARWRMAPEH